MVFTYPWQHSFPPFFTLQRHGTTRDRQLSLWASLFLDFCSHNNVAHVADARGLEVFENRDVERRLNDEAIAILLDHLVAQGHFEHEDRKKSCYSGYVYYRSPEEWSDMVYNYVELRGLKRSVCTIDELVEESDGEAFHNLDKKVLVKALKVLQKRNKAELFNDNQGVKFF